MPVERHYTGQQLAELLGLDYETVLGKAQAGEIESVRIGRLRRFPESAVNAYLDRNRSSATDVVVELRRRLGTPTPPKKRRRA